MKQVEIFLLGPRSAFYWGLLGLPGEEDACSSFLKEEIRHSPLNKELTSPTDWCPGEGPEISGSGSAEET